MRKHHGEGFTLAELLIVVAVIAVLVAIAIPVFHAQFEKARIAVDQSSVRSAKSLAAATYVSDGATGEVTYYYTGSDVVLTREEAQSIQGYGKSNVINDDGSTTGASGTPKDHYVIVTITEDGNITAKWSSSTNNGSEDTYTTKKDISSSIKIDTTVKKLGLNKGYRDWQSGELFHDETDTNIVYIFHEPNATNHHKYTLDGCKTFDALMAKYSSYFTTVNMKNADVLENTTYQAHPNVKKGTILEKDGKYYIAVSDITTYIDPKEDNNSQYWASLK